MNKPLIALFMSAIIILTTVYTAQALQITFNPSLSNVTHNSALIAWQTDAPANSTLAYWNAAGNATNETITLSEANLTLNHSYTLAGLNATTAYRYWFASSSLNETGVMNNSNNFYDFTTLNITPVALFINATIPLNYNSPRLTISGTTSPNALVHAYANPDPSRVGISFYDRETFADENGNFTVYELPLDASRTNNTVVLWARDDKGNTTSISGQVHLDLIPANVSYFIPPTTRTGSINISGTTNENITIEIYAGAFVNGTAPVLNETNLALNQTVILANGTNTTPFLFNIAMPGDKNLVLFNARDLGGNLITSNATVISDTIPPTFEVPTSLDAYSPTYTLGVEIEGKISEAGKVIAFVNGDQQVTEKTDENGKFKITVTLQKAVINKVNDSKFTAAYGSFINQTYIDTYPNFVTLMAVDQVGNTQNLTGTITYTPCGFGTWWSVNEGRNPQDYVMPTMLSPQMLLDGNAQISYSYILKWQGFGNYTFVSSNVKLAPLSQIYKDKFDADWVSGVSTTSPDGKIGYSVVKLMAPGFNENKNLTYREKLRRISEHRMTSGGSAGKITPVGGASPSIQYEPSGNCLIPHVGCVKVPLILEIQFESAEFSNSSVRQQTQKVCNFVEVTVDGSMFSMGDIPSEYLKRMIAFMENMIANIEPVEKFLKDTEKIMLYLYAAAIIGLWFVKFGEMFKCKFSKYFSQGFKDADAMQNCYREDNTKIPASYSSTDTKKEFNQLACNSCADAISARITYLRFMNALGDRLFMPSVPTLQTYIKGDSKNKLPGNWKNKYSWCYGGADASNPIGLGASNYVEMAQIAKPYLKDTAICPDLHIINTEAVNSISNKQSSKFYRCCAAEYYREWRSGCALLDPLEESACEADEAQYATTGKKLIQPGELTTKLKCHTAWNAVAGFCDPQSGYVPALVSTNWIWKDTTATGKIIGSIADTKKAFFLVAPDLGGESGLPSVTRATGIGPSTKGADTLSIGYIGVEAKVASITGSTPSADQKKTTDPSLSSMTKDLGTNMAAWQGGSPYPIQSGTVYYPYYLGVNNWNWIEGNLFDPSVDCNQCLKSGISALPSAPAAPSGGPCDKFNAFKDKINSLAKDGILDWSLMYNSQPLKDQETCRVYNDIRSKMGIKDKDYIIDPSQPNFFRSIQCIAIPSIISHLSMMKRIFTALKQCFQITLTTGDSSPTVCRDLLSRQVCDFVFEALKCFTNKYSLGYGGGREGIIGSISSVFGAMTSAGASVANSLQSRYGGDKLFYSIFGENRLINAICIFAFTGEWIFDLNALVDQDFPININSTVLITPAERRFVSANPLSTPSGFAFYNYKIGVAMIAGSDLTYDVQLICSNDYSCSPVNGYEGGKCDCVDAHGGQPDVRHFPLTASPSLSAGEALGEGGRGTVQYTQFEMPYRYDKVKVLWRWKPSPTTAVKEDSMTVPIKEVGGTPPAICKFRADFKMFLCDLGFSSAYVILQSVIPSQPTFYVGDRVQLRSTILQNIPKEAEIACQQNQCNYTTFLQVKFTRASDGRLMCQEPPLKVPLYSTTTLGFETAPSPIDFPTNCVLGSGMFDTTATSWQPHAILGSIDIQPNLRSVSSQGDYMIIAAKTGSSINYHICRITPEEFQYNRFSVSSNFYNEKSCKPLGTGLTSITADNGAIFDIRTQPSPLPGSCSITVMQGSAISGAPGTMNLCNQIAGTEGISAITVEAKQEGATSISGESIWNWEATLLKIDLTADPNSGMQIVGAGASSQIVVANGVPQRKTGTLLVRNVQSTSPEAVKPPQPTAAVTLPATITSNGENCAVDTTGAEIKVSCGSNVYYFGKATKMPSAYSTDSGKTRHEFNIEPVEVSAEEKAAMTRASQISSQLLAQPAAAGPSPAATPPAAPTAPVAAEMATIGTSSDLDAIKTQNIPTVIYVSGTDCSLCTEFSSKIWPTLTKETFCTKVKMAEVKKTTSAGNALMVQLQAAGIKFQGTPSGFLLYGSNTPIEIKKLWDQGISESAVKNEIDSILKDNLKLCTAAANTPAGTPAAPAAGENLDCSNSANDGKGPCTRTDNSAYSCNTGTADYPSLCVCHNKECVSKCSYCSSGGKAFDCDGIKSGWQCTLEDCPSGSTNCARGFCPQSDMYCGVATQSQQAQPTEKAIQSISVEKTANFLLFKVKTTSDVQKVFEYIRPCQTVIGGTGGSLIDKVSSGNFAYTFNCQPGNCIPNGQAYSGTQGSCNYIFFSAKLDSVAIDPGAYEYICRCNTANKCSQPTDWTCFSNVVQG